MAPNPSLCHESVNVRCPSGLRMADLQRAFNELVRRHQALRTVIRTEDGRLRQVVLDHRTAGLPVVDLRNLAADERRKEVRRHRVQATREPFDLERGPLWRAAVVNLGEGGQHLQLTVHRLVCDGESIRSVLLPELAALYGGFSEGDPSPLAEPRTQLAAHATRQRTWLEGAEARAELDYWREELQALPGLTLLLDHPRPEVQSFRAGSHPLSIPAQLGDALREVSRRQGVPLFAAFLASLQALLHRYSSQDEVVVGTVTSSRTRPELKGAVGPLFNHLVLRTDLSGDPTVAELLSRAGAVSKNALLHAELPFEQLVQDLVRRPDLRAHPLFQVLVTLEPLAQPGPKGWAIVSSGLEAEGTQFDLHLELEELRSGALRGRLLYNSDVFDRGTVAHLGGHLGAVLQAVATDPDLPLSRLPLFGQDDMDHLRAWNQTTSSLPDTRAHQLVEEQARRTPEALAVESGGERLSYGELDQRANQLGRQLQAMGAGAGAPVAICLEPGLELVVAVLAAMKAGTACLMLEPSARASAQAAVLEDCACGVAVTESHLWGAKTISGAPALCLDIEGGMIAALPVTPLETTVSADAPACLLHATGTRDKPRAVAVRHGSLVNVVQAARQAPGLSPEDVVVAASPPASGLTVLDLLLSLAAGASLLVATRDEAASGVRLGVLMDEAGATFMEASPQTWRHLFDTGWKGSRRLRAVAMGGPLAPSLAGRLLTGCREVWNGYGASETGIWSTIGRLEPGRPADAGRPLPNTTLHVVDGHGNPMPLGVAGEVLVGGAGVATGYFGRHQSGAGRFVRDTSGDTGATLFRSGEQGRFLPDGRLQFLEPPDEAPVPTEATREATPETRVEPRGRVEVAIAETWARALGRAQVGIHADFFELGGGALQAVQVAEELGRRFERALPPSAIFDEGHTVAGLARLLAGPALAVEVPPSDLVFFIRSGGRLPPLFMVAPDETAISALGRLLPHLEQERPLIGLLPRTAGGRFTPGARIEDLAGELVAALRGAQPAGPYRLSGFGFGGLLA
ncbi:MAG: AMP-binding protein, partial [Candidatus Dormibacteraeota bacterium]|nr:AMP-binding protein [Candidatus Dormibacteraeota bacterium]